MPVPENHRQYQRLSETLRQISRSFSRELPLATASLYIYFRDRLLLLDACDNMGRIITTLKDGMDVPQSKSSSPVCVVIDHMPLRALTL